MLNAQFRNLQAPNRVSGIPEYLEICFLQSQVMNISNCM